MLSDSPKDVIVKSGPDGALSLVTMPAHSSSERKASRKIASIFFGNSQPWAFVSVSWGSWELATESKEFRGLWPVVMQWFGLTSLGDMSQVPSYSLVLGAGNKSWPPGLWLVTFHNVFLFCIGSTAHCFSTRQRSSGIVSLQAKYC